METERHYLISIDGGGTKTGLCVLDRLSGEKRSCTYGGGNYKTQSIEAVSENILEGLRQLLPDEAFPADAADFTVFGVSGCDSEEDLLIYKKAMTALGFREENLFICNDSELIYRSLSSRPGICLVAGTGSIAFAFAADGSTRRAGGWGAPISDEGSGYWIGAEIIRAYLSYVDGIGPNDPFFACFSAAYPGMTDYEIAARLAALHPAETAAWAKTVLEAAPETPFCEKVVRAAAEKLAVLAASVYRQSRFENEAEIDIVGTGSLFRNAHYERCLREAIAAKIPRRNCHFLLAEGIPAEKGILLAEKFAEKSIVVNPGLRAKIG